MIAHNRIFSSRRPHLRKLPCTAEHKMNSDLGQDRLDSHIALALTDNHVVLMYAIGAPGYRATFHDGRRSTYRSQDVNTTYALDQTRGLRNARLFCAQQPPGNLDCFRKCPDGSAGATFPVQTIVRSTSSQPYRTVAAQDTGPSISDFKLDDDSADSYTMHRPLRRSISYGIRC